VADIAAGAVAVQAFATYCSIMQTANFLVVVGGQSRWKNIAAFACFKFGQFYVSMKNPDFDDTWTNWSTFISGGSSSLFFSSLLLSHFSSTKFSSNPTPTTRTMIRRMGVRYIEWQDS
jgi:hypothetical protein